MSIKDNFRWVKQKCYLPHHFLGKLIKDIDQQSEGIKKERRYKIQKNVDLTQECGKEKSSSVGELDIDGL